jgi:hypothetical protein
LPHGGRQQRQSEHPCAINQVASRLSESFFSSLKKEGIKKRIDRNRNIAVADISDLLVTFLSRSKKAKSSQVTQLSV